MKKTLMKILLSALILGSIIKIVNYVKSFADLDAPDIDLEDDEPVGV